MPRKGMRSVFFSSSSNSKSTSSPQSSQSSSPVRHTFSESIMEENIEFAESVITKWDLDSPTFTKFSSLFQDDRKEAKQLLKAVGELQKAMHFFVKENSSSHKLIRAQSLMQIAMKRLEKEFYTILSGNRNFLDAESVSIRSSVSKESTRSSVSDFDDDGSVSEDDDSSLFSEMEKASTSETVMADLKAIADCMISSGYGKECVKIYKIIRKSIVDETLYYLGVEKLPAAQFQKMEWEVLETKIKSWLNAVKVAVKTLFYGERILCDYVFSSADKIRESCFAEISRDGASTLFGFPENVAKMKKLSPEKMFRTLDMYEAISEHWPEIEIIFSFDSTSTVKSQAVTSLVKLGDAVRAMLSEFETAIQKDSSKSQAPGGGVHPLTRYVMNYLVFLSDYSGPLSDIVADWPLSVQSPLPESYLASPIPNAGDESSAISMRLAWLVLVLLCKLDGKAVPYKDVALSYLFLANNLNYVVSKVRTSNLKLLLGSEWLMTHESKVRQYASNYERMGWSKVMDSMPENPKAEVSLEEIRDRFRQFNSAFIEAYKKQSSWVIPDPKLRDEVKVSLAKRMCPGYREFYLKYRDLFNRREMEEESTTVRFAPDDVGNYLSDLFYGNGVSESATSYSTSTTSSSSKARGR